MKIKIDFQTKIPIYIQVIDQIKHSIAAGEINPDDQLPTVRQLATDLRVNFNTVARAYRILDEDGLISTQHGRGTYILPPKSDQNQEQLKRRDLRWLTRHYLNEASRLDYQPEDVQKVFNDYIDEWIKNNAPPPEHKP